MFSLVGGSFAMNINLPILWVALVIILALIEIFTQGLTTIWFCGGAAVSAVIAILGGGFPLQFAAFLIVSILLLVFTRPIAAKKLNSKVVATNAEALLGKTGVVVSVIKPFDGGEVKLNGLVWKAISENSEEIENSSTVVVKSIEGVKLIVSKV